MMPRGVRAPGPRVGAPALVGVLLLAARALGAGAGGPLVGPVAARVAGAGCAVAQTAVTVPGVSSSDPILLLAQGLDQPDDVVRSHGRVLVGEYGSGRIAQVDGRRGPLVLLAPVVPEVEGLAGLGPVLVAGDQAGDRVVTIAGTAERTLFQLRPVAGLLGVDGISAAQNLVIVPDSARGAILWVDRAGRAVRRLVGFDRPTGTWPLGRGSILVADENAGTVLQVRPSGARTVLAQGLDLPDDVARAADGTTYVVALGTDTLDIVSGGSARVLVSGLDQPQGLALDGAGNPIVTESAAGRLDLVVRTFAVSPPGPIPRLAPGGRLCVELVRAPGFVGGATIVPGSGYRALAEPGRGTVGAVTVAACRAICRVDVVVRAGRLTTGAWLAYR